MPVFEFLSSLISPVTNLIDKLVTTDEDRLQIKAKLLEVETAFSAKVLDYEQKILDAQASIIVAETKSESWITSSWRPITMLSFVFVILLSWIAPIFKVQLPAIPTDLWDVIKIGLGGYVIGRSAEKALPNVIASLKKKEEV